MVKKKTENNTIQAIEKKEKRACRKKIQQIPFLPVTEDGQELTPINPKNFPDTIGGILQQARSQKHMKLPSISKKLRIREEFLDALEKGNYNVFPAKVYGIGFLRTYANFLGLNADELISRLKKESSDTNSPSLDMPRAHDPKIMPTPMIILKSLVALLLIYSIWTIFRIMTYTPFPEPQMPGVRWFSKFAVTVVSETKIFASVLIFVALIV